MQSQSMQCFLNIRHIVTVDGGLKRCCAAAEASAIVSVVGEMDTVGISLWMETRH